MFGLLPLLLKGITGKGRHRRHIMSLRPMKTFRGMRGGRRKTPRRHQVKAAWVKSHTRHRRR